MTPDELVKALKAEVIDDNIAMYRDMYQHTNRHDAIDAYWSRALGLYDKLNADERDVLFEIIRQVAIDIVSNILGILDDTSPLPGIPGTEEVFHFFHLMVESDPTVKLNGELQDTFLELIEEES